MSFVGCIGCGNMGSAIVKRLALCDKSLNILVFDKNKKKVDALTSCSNNIKYASVEEIAEKSDFLIPAIKPQHLSSLFENLLPLLRSETIIVSIAAAVEITQLNTMLQNKCAVARTMPNLPVEIGKGLVALALPSNFDPKTAHTLEMLLQHLGQVLLIPEDKFSAFTAIAGCGPAYVYLVMEAMQQAAVTLGFPAQQAKEMVTATLEGSAILANQSDSSFADMRTKVCSPAGVTIYGINHLERNSVRAHICDAILAAYHRDLDMKK